MTTERAQEIFQNGIKRKMIPDTQWLTSTLENIVSGKADPLKSVLAFKHRKLAWKMFTTRTWTGNHFEIGKYAEKRIFPPRPQQTRLTVTSAQKASIITLHGPSRTGKTTAAVRAAMMVSATGDKPSIFSINGMRMSYFNKERIDEAVQDAIEASIVILDDIDKGSKGEVMINAVFEILTARENVPFVGPVIVTTNLFGTTLARQFRKLNPSTGDAIVAKLEAGICINFEPEKIDFDAAHEHVRQKLIAMDANDEGWTSYLDGYGKFRT